jgi:hypothetical protein
MKKAFAIVVTLLFLFNMMGYYFVFSYNQYLVRGEMKQLIKAGNFQDSYIVLKIVNPSSNPDFKRVEKGEFLYKNKLYDIVSEARIGNLTTFRCINDKNEEKLLAGFHQYFELACVQNNPVKARHARAILYHVIKLALVENHLTPVPVVPTEISFISPTYSLSSIIYPPISPPPKSVSA